MIAIYMKISANRLLPKCCVLEDSDDPQERNFAKFYVVKDPNKESYGRPFFKCSKENDRCKYFEWGDETIIQKPLCKHGKQCKVWKVKKEGPNQGRSFLSCPQQREEKCNFFRWFDPTPVPNPVKKEPVKNTFNEEDDNPNEEDDNPFIVYAPKFYMDYNTETPKPKRVRRCVRRYK